MLKIKKSGSGLQLSKINTFNKLNDCFSYNKNYEKITHIEFEMERQKEILVKLKTEINNKSKEIKELTLRNQNEKNNQLKTIKLIEEILKIYNNKKESKLNSPKLEIETEIDKNTIDNKIKEKKEKEKDLISNTIDENDNDIYNKTNIKTFYTTNNNFANTNKNQILPKIKSPKFKSKLFINTNTFIKRKKNKDILYMKTLRNQINTLKEKLEKKKEEIFDYNSKCEENNIKNLENDILLNYDEIKELKYKNAEMLDKLEDFLENYYLQREENFLLRNKLNNFIDIFNTYKENTEKNNLILESKLKNLEEKNLRCIILHHNNFSKYREDNKSKLTEAGNIKEKIKEEIEELNKDIKSKKNNIIQNRNEIEILINKKKEINENIKKNEDNINKMNIQKEKSDKSNKEKEHKKINLKNKCKEIKLKYKNLINQVNEMNEMINKKDEEINVLKKQIEKLNSEKNNY